MKLKVKKKYILKPSYDCYEPRYSLSFVKDFNEDPIALLDDIRETAIDGFIDECEEKIDEFKNLLK